MRQAPHRAARVRVRAAPIETAADLPAAFQRVAQAAASGEIPIDDAARFAGVLELARRAIETSALADRVAQLEAHLGDRNLRPVS